LVDLAKRAGADAVKFQTFKAENLVTDSAQQATYQKQNTGCVESQFEMLKKLELSFNDFKKIKNYCDQVGVTFLSTPFDEECADFLVSELNMPYIKVSSGDANNLPFIDFLLQYKKPLIISTGMCSLEEVDQVVEHVNSKNGELTLLHCTSNYPCQLDEVNLRVISTFQKRYQIGVGYSDHTLGYEIALAAVAMGASIIEKHYTLDTQMPGPDHLCSLNPDELVQMIKSIRELELAMGSNVKAPSKSEMETRLIVRKSLVLAKKMEAGSLITEEDVIIKRPGTGISPNDLPKVIGRQLKKNKQDNEILTWDDLV